MDRSGFWTASAYICPCSPAHDIIIQIGVLADITDVRFQFGGSNHPKRIRVWASMDGFTFANQKEFDSNELSIYSKKLIFVGFNVVHTRVCVSGVHFQKSPFHRDESMKADFSKSLQKNLSRFFRTLQPQISNPAEEVQLTLCFGNTIQNLYLFGISTYPQFPTRLLLRQTTGPTAWRRESCLADCILVFFAY